MTTGKTELTDEIVKALACPLGKARLLSDRKVTGFRVLVSATTGKKYFVFDWQEDGQRHRANLGSTELFTVEQARAIAYGMAVRLANVRAEKRFERNMAKSKPVEMTA